MNFLILEDNSIQSKALCKNLIEFFPKSKIVICKSISKAMAATQKTTFDTFLIDIELNNENGIIFAEILLKDNPNNSNKIVFTTAHKKYAIEAINKTHCHSYLVKPYSMKDLIIAIQSILDISVEYTRLNNYLRFSLNRITHIVDKQKIIYIETYNKKPWIHTSNNILEMPRCSLSKLLNQLNDKSITTFLQCRRDCIINIHYISKIINIDSIYYITLNNGIEIPIGAKFKTNIFNTLKKTE